jgi:hypothetical protein
MSFTRPVPADRQLPRGLLLLNRSFRRALEAENKSPRTIEAYTDAVRLLATYCQAHGHPLLAAELHASTSRRSSPTSWPAGSQRPRTTAIAACTPSSSGRWPRAISRSAPWAACDRRSCRSSRSR